MSTTPRLLGQSQLSPASSSPSSGQLYQQWLLSASGTGKFTPVLSGHQESRSPKHLGPVPRPHCPAKCHRAPRKHTFTLAPTPSRSRAESLRSQPSTNLESASRSHCLPSSWLWRTPGPGDTGLTGEIIMFYPSLTSLSVSQTRTDKCSDARKHFCGIYLCSLVLAGSPFPGTTPRDQPAPCYLVPVTTRCCSLVNCQTVLS